jgi:hypothetical protein
VPGPYTPQDTLIGPIIHQIAVTIQTEIPSIEYVWEKTPDRAPSNNQVLLPLLKGKVLSDTNGKMKLLLTIGARHLFRRTELDAGITAVYTYIMPWLMMLDAWPNQTLAGLAMSTTPKDFAVTRMIESGQVFIALAVDFDVLTEFNIPLS